MEGLAPLQPAANDAMYAGSSQASQSETAYNTQGNNYKSLFLHILISLVKRCTKQYVKCHRRVSHSFGIFV